MTFRCTAVALALILAFLAVGWVVFSNPTCNPKHPNQVFCPSSRD